MATSGVQFDEDFFVNERGMRLNTCRWLPVEKDVKGLVFLCHGYGMECTIYTRETGLRLASAGYAVYGIDYEGHGKSDGLRAFVPNFDDLVTDCATFFNGVMDREEYAGKPSFLLGESLGGAVSLLVSRRDPARWSGVVLVAPMLKISQKVKPAPFVISLLVQLSNFIPTWKIVPTKDIIDNTFKDPLKREEVRSNPYTYQEKPRLKTAVGMLQVSDFMEEHLAEVSLPFLCVHGLDDKVNDPEASQKLYDSAASFDKTLKLYPGMWHGLTTGEPDDNIDLVFGDITRWLNKRADTGFHSPTLRSNSVGAFADDSKSKFRVQETEQSGGLLRLLSF
ncbi:unnamed protein product [Calypogeia fissa]